MAEFELFAGLDVYQYFEIKEECLIHEIDDLTAAELAGRTVATWQADLLAKYRIEPVRFYPYDAQFTCEEAMVAPISLADWVPDVDPHKDDPPEPGYLVMATFPFSGDEVMLYVRPSEFAYKPYLATSVTAPTTDQLGTITIKREFQIGRVAPDQVEWEADRLVTELGYHFFKLFKISAHDTQQYNASLPALIEEEMIKRLSKPSTNEP
ncbi:hypothetical protein FC15_GL001577 [Lapidilactobacillus concavus DSM 17758]|uniref:Uncharacterized protein n=1 Tax=Lapidilactobacillus concavus DSM 17758 TaxID=1423735 RepID=A0A0R1VWQ5_9LACO|nr:hypothetical protein [Lapidilactobacillus concavus]KRM09807.1 hypothetical protein FC15_GL001577 [Lapidilactobacillus concavus DSM 17758]GEL14066.1 hypothetical protein LCO01nite_16150 [Lapidilactobacillus concavus]